MKKTRKVNPNWESLQLEFVSSNYSLLEFSRLREIPYSTLNRRAKKNNWLSLQKDYRNGITNGAMAYVRDIKTDALVEQCERDIEATRRIYALIMEYLERGGLKPNDLKTLTGAIKDIQTVARLALGASTENSANSSLIEFENWLGKKVAQDERQDTIN